MLAAACRRWTFGLMGTWDSAGAVVFALATFVKGTFTLVPGCTTQTFAVLVGGSTLPITWTQEEARYEDVYGTVTLNTWA